MWKHRSAKASYIDHDQRRAFLDVQTYSFIRCSWILLENWKTFSGYIGLFLRVLIAVLYSGHICLFEDSNSWRWVIVKQYINIMINDRGCTVITINIGTEILEQTVWTQIRLLLWSSLIRVCTVAIPPGIS